MSPLRTILAACRASSRTLEPDHPRPRFAEPSPGSGSFHSAALSVFGRYGFEQALGIEIDPVFADAAESSWGMSGLQMIRGDFTQVITQCDCPPAPGDHGAEFTFGSTLEHPLVMERQAVTTDKDSGITNDANLRATETMGNARYPLELFLRVVTVSLETNRIVAGLPGLEISVESSS